MQPKEVLPGPPHYLPFLGAADQHPAKKQGQGRWLLPAADGSLHTEPERHPNTTLLARGQGRGQAEGT